MDARILIIGTSPYDVNTPARAFDSYFHYYPKESLIQFFSAPIIPTRGHCVTLYRITDRDILNKWLRKPNTRGKRFDYDKLEAVQNYRNTEKEYEQASVSKLYAIGHNKNSLIYLLRGILWKKSYWCEKELCEWVDNFKPECIFLAFSDDYFIPQIALYFSQKYNIPIVSCIGDDYYFNYRRTLSPLYHIYKLTYRALVRKVFRQPGSAIYIGNKIRDKYNSEFGINGKTVYLTSQMKRREFRPINKDKPQISYFGNIRLGRNESLAKICSALRKINPNYAMNVYTNEKDERYLHTLKGMPNCIVHGPIPYEEVIHRTESSDILLVVEGFKKKDIDISRYSLSTKVADSLSSGVCVFAFGSSECGAIEYSLETGAITTCTSEAALEGALRKIIFHEDEQRRQYEKAAQICSENHSLSNSCKIFKSVIDDVIMR